MLLILVGLFYLWIPGKSSQVLVTDKTFVSIFDPVQNLLQWVSRSISEKIDHYFLLVDVKTENEKLKKEVEQLRLKNYAYEFELEDWYSYERLKRELPFKTDNLVPAQILSHDLFVPSKSVMINVGKADGLAEWDVVLTHAGLVGRVLRVFENTSQVLLLTDPHFHIDVMSKDKGSRLIVKGVDSDLLWGKGYPLLMQSEFLLHEQVFVIGEKLVASGFGGIYPKGLPVGTITKIKSKSSGLFSEANILPAVDFTKIQDLYVLIKKEKE